MITCVLSENPTQGGTQTRGGAAYVQEQLQWLIDTANDAELLDIVTPRLGTFVGYLIESAPVQITNVQHLRFDLSLREVRIATGTTITIQAADVSAEVAAGAPDAVDLGEQPTTDTAQDPAAEAADKSVLAGLLDAL